MRLCSHCKGWGRWTDLDVRDGAPPLSQGVCGKECGSCKGDGLNLGVEVDSDEERDAFVRWSNLARASLRVRALRQSLALAEADHAALSAAAGKPEWSMRHELGVPDELLSRAHWARDAK